ncbi:MAG: hypothetical protein ACQETH_03540 [Candidatus Rifleibacteriota bacterium]
MKKIKIFFLVCFIVQFLFFPSSLKSADIAKVNLGLAISLHPKMSLFDFDRMGFFKVQTGLSNEEFQTEVQQLKKTANSSKLEDEINELQNQLIKIDTKKGRIMNEPALDSNAEIKRIEKLRELNSKTDKVLKEIDEIKYQQSCPELTNPEKTREILNKIEQETLSTLKQISAKKGYEIVLNSSITVPFNYPLKYVSGEQYGLGVPGIDYSLFYSFLANRDHILPSDEIPESRKLINWLELVHSPDSLDMLPLKPYPLVLSGGDDLTTELVTNIYQKYEIDEKVISAVESVLDLIERHNLNYDTEIDKIMAPD